MPGRIRPWKYLFLTFIVVLVAIGAAIAYSQDSLNSPSQQVACTDPASINSHVYNPNRLQIVKTCTTVSGTVDRVYQNDDGDAQIWLSLDSAYDNLTNNANLYGELVVGIICVGQPVQPDALSACQNYSNSIPVPGEGVHVSVSGPYVLDSDHADWAAIHPVYQLGITGRSIGATSHIQENLNVSYANNATSGWLGPTVGTILTPVTTWEGDLFTESLSLYSTSSSSEAINSIGISNDGFKVLFVTPQTPISFSPNAAVTVTLTVHAPDFYYHGPIDIEVEAS